MLRQKTLALVLAAAFSSSMVYAAPLGSIFHKDKTTTATSSNSADVNSVHTMFAKSKTVKLVLHNTSSSPMELRAGETIITVEAGKTVTVNLPPGIRILTNSATDKHPAGTLIIEVNSALNGVTIDLT